MFVNQDVLIPLFAAFVISVLLSPVVIPFLQKLKVGQTEREEGVQSHLKKAGTPTMGGLIILISLGNIPGLSRYCSWYWASASSAFWMII